MLFELNPAPRAIEATEVERYVDGRLLVREATRLGLETTADERAEAWAAAAGRAGGKPSSSAWLRRADVDGPAWARRLVDEDLTRRRFVELRFRDLAFVSDADVTAAMGPGAHGEAAREAVRARSRTTRARRRLGEWLGETRARSVIRRLVDQGARSPGPWPAPRSTADPRGSAGRRRPDASRAGDQPAVVADRLSVRGASSDDTRPRRIEFVTTAIRFQSTTGLEPMSSPYQIHRIWKAPMMAAIFGFMPALDRRLTIEIRSGKAAKVVPNPATEAEDL